MSKTYDELKRAEYSRRCPNIVPAGMCVKGDVSGEEDLVVAGTLEGLIQIKDGTLTVEETGRVFADIVAREVIVFGEVQGNIAARDRVEIGRQGTVIGDVATTRIVIDDGANFKGAMEIISRPTRKVVVPVALQPEQHNQALSAVR